LTRDFSLCVVKVKATHYLSYCRVDSLFCCDIKCETRPYQWTAPAEETLNIEGRIKDKLMATVRPLCPRHILFYDSKISVPSGFFKFAEMSRFFISRYFLQLLHILTLRLLMSYIYGAPILDVSRSHTTTHHSR